MKIRKIQKADGFTIVELLIVIVVIGVLAAVAVFAYNGISKRAQDARTVAAVDSWDKALRSYGVINGSYPYDGWTGTFCLAKMPAEGDFGENQCIFESGSSSGSSLDRIESQLQAEGFDVPDGSIGVVEIGSSRKRRALSYTVVTLGEHRYKRGYTSYPLVQNTCLPGDSVSYQLSADGSYIHGQPAPGTAGRIKLCKRDLPNL